MSLWTVNVKMSSQGCPNMTISNSVCRFRLKLLLEGDAALLTHIINQKFIMIITFYMHVNVFIHPLFHLRKLSSNKMIKLIFQGGIAHF